MTDIAADLVRPAEAAKALCVSPETLKSARLRRLAPNHPLYDLPFVRVGGPRGRVCYRRADIDRFIQHNLVGAA